MRKSLLTVTLAGCLGLLACEDVIQPPAPPQDAILPAQGASGVTVMTRNVYLGFDIDAVMENPELLPAGLAELQATNFVARAGALADEIAATRPHLIGLQEVIKYRYEIPSDFLSNFTPDAEEPLIPFLYILQQQLAVRGLEYDVAVENPTTDVELPMDNPQSPSGDMDIRYTDHDVILVRSDVEWDDATSALYDARLHFMMGGLPLTRPLGYAAVKAVVNGRPLLFVSTHLETQGDGPESQNREVQEAQIQELMGWMAEQDLPIVLVGDLNSAANASAPAVSKTDTYGMLLEAGFHDVWLRGHPGNEGLTCCHANDLLADRTFDQRIDLILLNNGAAKLIGGVQTAIVGVDPFQEAQPRWASDHAGLVATLRLPMGPQE